MAITDYKIGGISEAMLNTMLNSDDPQIRQQAEDIVNKAEADKEDKSNIIQKISDFFGIGQAGAAEPNMSLKLADDVASKVYNTPGFETVLNTDGTISNVPVGQTNNLPFTSMATMDAANQFPILPGSSTLPLDAFKNTVAPMGVNTGIMTQAPDFKKFEGITEETDIDDDTQDVVEKEKSSGVLDLMGMLIPGFNFLRNLDGQPYERFDPRASIKGGIYSIGNFNQPASLVNDFYNPRTGLNRFERAQKRYERTGSVKDLFASSRSGAEFFRKLRERKAANQRALETAAKRKRDIQQFTGGGGGDGPQIQDRPATTSQGLTTSQFQAFRN